MSIVARIRSLTDGNTIPADNAAISLIHQFGTTNDRSDGTVLSSSHMIVLKRVLMLVVAVLSTHSLSAQSNPTAREREVIEWVTRSLIDQQKHDWNDWSTATDRRVVLLVDETIRFPQFAGDDYGLDYALQSLKEERPDLYSQLLSAPMINLGTWRPVSSKGCDADDESFPQVDVVPARTLARVFDGESLESFAALVIRTSPPVYSSDGTTAVVYAEAVGSHVENSSRQLILLTRKNDRPDEWDAVIHVGRLFSRAAALPRERKITNRDHAVMTAALQWLVAKRGQFDLVGLADFPPDPAEWVRRERESLSSFEVPETTLAQLCRRNRDELVFDASSFSISGVRDLEVGDKRIWSRPSVLVSLPAYDGETAILSMMYRTSDDIPETAHYLVVMQRSNGEWSVAWSTVQEGVIVS